MNLCRNISRSASAFFVHIIITWTSIDLTSKGKERTCKGIPAPTARLITHASRIPFLSLHSDCTFRPAAAGRRAAFPTTTTASVCSGNCYSPLASASFTGSDRTLLSSPLAGSAIMFFSPPSMMDGDSNTFNNYLTAFLCLGTVFSYLPQVWFNSRSLV
jgi:hypothetical protein